MAEPQSQLAMWLPPVLAAFSAAGLTAWFSLLRFRKERWWEKKFESYAAIMEALHNIGAEIDEELDPSTPDRTISEERRLELAEQRRKSEKEIYKQIDIGQFLLPKDAVLTLQKFLRDIGSAEGERDLGAYLDGSSKAVHSCIERMRLLAKEDLRPGPLDFASHIFSWLRNR
jgi:hypothetical protein